MASGSQCEIRTPSSVSRTRWAPRGSDPRPRITGPGHGRGSGGGRGDEGTNSQQQALRGAQQYLEFSAFSRQSLIDQLSSEYGSQFPIEDATWAADHVGADWNAEAAEAAADYLEFSSFSRAGLIDQLTSEYGSQFTQEQAEYGVSRAGL